MLNNFSTGISGVVALCLVAGNASGQIAVSSNDHKMVQENGVTSNVADPKPDTITILDLGTSPVKVIGTVSGVPGSVAGPPLSVVLTSDGSMALVASSTKIDPADKTKVVPDNRVTVVDLRNQKVIGQVEAGPGAAGLSLTKDGKRAYVANRGGGSITLLSLDGTQVRSVKTEVIATAADLVSHVALSPDGTTGIAAINNAAKIAILKLQGDQISVVRTLDVVPRPYPIVFSPSGKFAVVGCGGDPKGGNGALVVVDFSSDPAGKIVDTIDTGHESLEGMMMSSDGKWVAVVLHAGSTRPKDAPQYKPNGVVALYRVDGMKLVKASEAPIGVWSQGAAFSSDGKTLVVQNMVQHNLQVFRNDDGKLTDTGTPIDVVGGAAAIRTVGGL
jgi:DNA-binding beta-propeller fold protein YncE